MLSPSPGLGGAGTDLPNSSFFFELLQLPALGLKRKVGRPHPPTHSEASRHRPFIKCCFFIGYWVQLCSWGPEVTGVRFELLCPLQCKSTCIHFFPNSCGYRTSLGYVMCQEAVPMLAICYGWTTTEAASSFLLWPLQACPTVPRETLAHCV